MAGKRHTIGSKRGVQVVWMVLACLACLVWGGVVGGIMGARLSVVGQLQTDYLDANTVTAKNIVASSSITLMGANGQTAAMLFVDSEGKATLALHDRNRDADAWLDSSCVMFSRADGTSARWPKDK